MNTLNLIHLNSRSPTKYGAIRIAHITFETKYGVRYKIYFGDDAPIWKSGAYTFDIQNTNQKNSPSDNNVKLTIIAIIEEFFHSKLGHSPLHL